MSWWDIGDGGVIGDGPADVMTLALEGVARERTDAGRRKPSLESVLSGMADALPRGDRPSVIVASLADGREVKSDHSGADVAIALREALAEIDRQYAERWARSPEPRELLELLMFMLSGSAESVLRDGEGLELRGIEARQ